MLSQLSLFFILIFSPNYICVAVLIEQNALVAYLTKELDGISPEEKNYLEETFSLHIQRRGVINLPGKVCRKIMKKVNLDIYYLETLPGGDFRSLQFNKALREFLEYFSISKRIIDREIQCPICHENVRDRVRTACNHYFCKLCLMSWFAYDKPRIDNAHSQCPTCRAPFSKRVKRALYTTSGYRRELSINLRKKKEHREHQELEDRLLALNLEADLDIADFEEQ